ncbi:MAG: cell wall hydrolase [Pseudomonadota bacterium]
MTLFRRAALALTLLAAACAPAPETTDIARTAAEVDARDFECLREAIYHEASARSVRGGRAVANVILNRAADPRFPNTVCGVIREGEARGRCQFSYRCDGRPEILADAIKRATATEAARLALENPGEDVTDGALFFHANWMEPGWFGTLDRKMSAGGNTFYGDA